MSKRKWIRNALGLKTFQTIKKMVIGIKMMRMIQKDDKIYKVSLLKMRENPFSNCLDFWNKMQIR
ncbi:hypothetical protein [Bacillus bingmayongensis]|uniref:Transposase n=1 Tax=Bacillus bingmayongensis TaxID=1150157 RepID=A0ABU5JZB0_9BACI|nr:hypothetical protein [Bacillus bingmayongensis]MBY0596372.1 hypothetical protein [Bacillus bingmayongensis]MDZ5608512.1 hypothetical protein [Bacillus pseudomycoides]